VFIGPQIRQLFKDQQFEAVLSDRERAARQTSEKVSKGFFFFGGGGGYFAENALFILTPGIFPLNCDDMTLQKTKYHRQAKRTRI
jgi:hypothetical protein